MRAALAAALGEAVADLQPVAGGSLNAAFAATLAGGARVFVKTSPDAAPGVYAAEAAGLRWLGTAGGLPVPGVLAVGDAFLALEWVEGGGAPDPEALGHGLARLHRAGADGPGALPPHTSDPDHLLLGPLALANAPEASWPAFYAANRLLPLVRMAADRGALDAGGVRAVERVASRIDALAGPEEPTARLHGDLWSGNVHAGADGRPWLIDPAAHGGHREMDLAMLTLFGGPPPAFFSSYDEVWPRSAGVEDRVGVWQLFPLLVHAVLFGGSYGDAARRTAERLAG